MRKAGPITLLLLGLALLVPGRAWAEPTQLVVAFIVNEQRHPDLFVLQDGADFLVREPDLAAAGVRTDLLQGRLVQNGGEAWASLSSLRPAVEFSFDEELVELRLRARPELLSGSTVVDLGSSRPPPGLFREQAPSLFFNYGVVGTDLARTGSRLFLASGEAGISAAGMLWYSAASTNIDGELVRGLSNASLDLPGILARLVIGDAFASSGLLGGSTLVGGVQLARHFELDPWFEQTLRPGLSGAAETPSVLEVYVDDVLVRREPIAPGTFEVRNLPVSARAGETRYVLRDAFGRERAWQGRYNVGVGLLRPGVTDFSYTVGARREKLGFESFDYGGPLLLASHRLGVTPWLTAGLRLEGARNLVSGGGSLGLRLPLGVLSVEGAASSVEQQAGASGALGWSAATRHLGLSLWAEATSARYGNLSLAPEADRALLDAGASLSLPLGWWFTPSVQAERQWMRDSGTIDRQSVGTSWRLAGPLSLGITGSHFSGPTGSGYEAFAQLTVILRRSASANVWASAGSDRKVGGISFQEQPEGETGWGYRAALTQGDAEGIDVRGGYAGSFGRYAAQIQSIDRRTIVGAEASGGVVAIGSRLFLTRPIDRSFALVRVPGVADAEVRLNHRAIGRTDSNGDLLAMGLQPYDANRLSIDPTQLPIDLAFGETERLVAPPLRGGTVTTFAGRRFQAIRGVAQVRRGGVVEPAALGELTVFTEAGPVTSPLGTDGRFELDSIGAGRHPVELRDRRGTCRTEVEIPATTDSWIDLGTVLCTEGVLQ